nr:unnamed protein product [Callosobruchus analis]
MEHLEGMLDRDQRTAKMRFLNSDSDGSKESRGFFGSCHLPKCDSFMRTDRRCAVSYFIGKKGYLARRLRSLKNVLLVSFYLTLVSLPPTNSAPSSLRMQDGRARRREQQPKWINPCGYPNNCSDPEHNAGASTVSDKDLVTQIVTQTGVALNWAREFKETYAQSTFNKNSTSLHKMMEEQKIDWLELLPKKLGEEMDQEYLKNLELDETLLNVYRYLQTIAVGLEQMTWDQEDRNGDFVDEFRIMEQQLRSVLCELQNTMCEKNIPITYNVQRDVMKEEYRRDRDATSINPRDWIIFREYMNTLEYVLQAFQHFKDKL